MTRNGGRHKETAYHACPRNLFVYFFSQQAITSVALAEINIDLDAHISEAHPRALRFGAS